MKVLLLNVNRNGWHSGNMVYDMEAVYRACDTVRYGPGWPNYEYNDLPSIVKQVYGDDKPDVIYSYFTPNERVGDVYIKQYGIPEHLWTFPTQFDKVKGPTKIFALSDFWARRPAQFSHDLGQDEADFSHCFCCFAPPYSNPKHFFSFFDEDIQKKIKFVGYPRCVDADCYKDYGSVRFLDVITVGAMWNFYPFRVMMHNTLQQHHQELGIKYKNYPHCGVNWGHNGFVREVYATAINGSKMLASCGGKYNLAMNKIFESMGCGTVYVGPKPYGADELYLKDGENCLFVNGNNFMVRMIAYLNDPKELDRISQTAQEDFKKHHTIDARASDFRGLLESL